MNNFLSYQIKSLAIHTELLEALDWDDNKLDLVGDIITACEAENLNIRLLEQKIVDEFGYDIWIIVKKSIKIESEFMNKIPEA
jgi:hypothetical protein